MDFEDKIDRLEDEIYDLKKENERLNALIEDIEGEVWDIETAVGVIKKLLP